MLLFQCHLLFGTVSAEVPCTHPPDWGRVRHRVRQLLHEEAPRGPGLVQLVALLEWPGPVCCACVCVVNVAWSMLCVWVRKCVFNVVCAHVHAMWYTCECGGKKGGKCKMNMLKDSRVQYCRAKIIMRGTTWHPPL